MERRCAFLVSLESHDRELRGLSYGWRRLTDSKVRIIVCGIWNVVYLMPRKTLVGLRDRALIGTMVYTFGRVGAVLGMNVEDYFISERRRIFRFHEKGGKQHEVPAHHNAIEYVEEYLDAAGLWNDRKAPIFQSVNRQRELTGDRMHRNKVWKMIKRRAKAVGLPETANCHTFRATGITNYLKNNGSLENARAIASHESSQTTRLYDRSGDKLTLDEIERIRI